MIVETKEVLERLSEFPISMYEPGDVVIHEDSATNRLLVLQRGVVDVVKQDVLLARIDEPGAVFGDMAFILGRPHTAHVLASTSSSFYVIKDAGTLLDAEPQVGRYLMVELAKRLDAVNRLLIDARSAYLEADKRHGVLDDMFAKIGRALHIGARD